MSGEWLLFYIGITESPFGTNRQTELQNVSCIMTKGKRLKTTVTQVHLSITSVLQSQ